MCLQWGEQRKDSGVGDNVWRLSLHRPGLESHDKELEFSLHAIQNHKLF